jgi:hypothetical protein
VGPRRLPQPSDGEIAPWAQEIVDAIASYNEISPSGTGLRIFVYGVLPPYGRRIGQIECYCDGRYLTLTGHHLPGTPRTVERGQERIDVVHARLFPHAIKATMAGQALCEVGSPRTVFDDSDEPPVALDPEGLAVYQGKRPTLKGGQIDRSDSLWKLGCVIWEANGSRSLVERVVAERDVALGWNCYSNRPDAAKQYRTIAQRIAVSKPRTVAPVGSVASGAPPATNIAQLQRDLARATEQIATLKVRIRFLDERLAALQNRNLGTAAPVAAALIQFFASEAPKRPSESASHRMPLDRLAGLTGQSPDTCSRHLKQLASYTLPDGTPLIHREVLDIPGGVDVDTGEVITPRKEVWIGPGVPVEEFAAAVATIAPPERKAWGGKRDDGMCADHPEDGVIERQRDQRVLTYECATCKQVLEEKVIPIGKPKARMLLRIPTPQDAGLLPTHDDDLDGGPMPQLAGTMRPHARVAFGQSGKMRDREPVGFTQRLLAPPTAEEEASGLAAWAKGKPETPIDHWSS